MKQLIFLMMFCYITGSAASTLTAQSGGSYRNGNGTIIESKIKGNTKTVTRKHNQRVEIGDMRKSEDLIVYGAPQTENSSKVYKLSYGEYVNISELFVEEDIKNGVKNTWLKINTDKGVSGWIYYGNKDPYDDDNWIILETITTGKKTWTVRKLEQWFAVWETLNVRDVPGLDNSRVLFKIGEKGQQVNVRSIAVTEEEERIDNINDRWIKINHEGKIGWIFAGYATIERGGYKYYIPELYIDFYLGYAP